MPGKRVSSISIVLAKPKAIVVTLGLQGETIITGSCPTPSPILQEHQQLVVPTAGQLMHRFQAQPVFPIRLPKAHLAG